MTPFFPVGYGVNSQQPSYTFSNSSVLIPLPDSQLLQTGITVDVTGTIFNVAVAGVHRIAYFINITTPQPVYANLVINSVDNNDSTVDTGDTISNLACEIIISLPASSTVSLRFGSGEAAISAELATGCGASLIIQRLN